MLKLKCYICAALLLCSVSAFAQRETLDLSGEWNSSLGKCTLPGTTDENRLGGPRVMTGPTSQLTRLYPYRGKVIYEKDVEIPKSMTGKDLSLYMERTKPSTLWIDGDSIGAVKQLYAPHVYPLPKLKAGLHHITIAVDNSDTLYPSCIRGSHAWTDATQTNWNGILGEFKIIAAPKTKIVDCQVYPDIEKKEARVRLKIYAAQKESVSLSLKRSSFDNENSDNCRVTRSIPLKPGENEIEIPLYLGNNPRLWSEYHPDLYTLTATLRSRYGADEISKQFGVRKFEVDGTQFLINGKKTFMRGTHDGCVFPLTGYAPTDVEEWKHLFSIAKEYGINHFRFHSYTPTEAAFQAADEIGIYLQTELPLWGAIDRSTEDVNGIIRHEAFTLLQYLGNHPSFMGLGLGNEIWGDAEMMREWLDEFRVADDRHLYCFGSNNDLGFLGPKEGEDYYVTCRVGNGEGFSTHSRTSFSFADAEHGGILNWLRPNTQRDFSYPVSLCNKPIISHETCQFQIYPDYRELKKYTGVLYPYNLETFRSRLEENGLTQQIDEFHNATGKWAVECYKADMEYCRRTRGFGGYQLLDIKDYPGQGSALCGILDAFMETKGLVEPEVFLGWNAPVVPLALIPSYCFTTDDTLTAEIAVSNFTEDSYPAVVEWNIETVSSTGKPSKRIAEGVFEKSIEQGTLDTAGNIFLPLASVGESTQMRILLKCGEYQNSYNLWVYADAPVELSPAVMVADTLSKEVEEALLAGRRVLLVPNHKSIENQSIEGLFTPDYWNYAMFKTISENGNKPVSPGTLGMLMDPVHPMFASFPTEGHTNWQWWCIALNSRPLILDPINKNYFPIIQTVDNVERNHKLGILMEMRVGNGSLLICTTDLNGIGQFPEGRAYADAIRRYVSGDDFNPAFAIDMQQLRNLLYSKTEERDIQGVQNLTDYNK